MDNGVSVLRLAGALTRHAASEHSVTARNIARADIPSATRQSVVAFRESLAALGEGKQAPVASTASPISLESEMLVMAEARGRHEAATAIWRSALNMMRLATTGPQG